MKRRGDGVEREGRLELRVHLTLLLTILCARISPVTTQTPDSQAGPETFCSVDFPTLCTDRCTLDGQRESPCQFECDPATGICSDKCADYLVDSAVALDEFDPFCANRKALVERDAFVLDGFTSPLRAPPGVYRGLSTVPFSMFRNGLLHTGRSEHPGPTEVNVTWTFKTGGRIFSSPTLASDGTVYVGCTDGFVYGIQRSGVIKWKYPAGGPVVSTAAIGNPIGSDTTLFMGRATKGRGYLGVDHVFFFFFLN